MLSTRSLAELLDSASPDLLIRPARGILVSGGWVGWGDSGVRGGSSSRSGDPLGISRTIRGRSSCGTREADSTATCWSSRGMQEAGLTAGGSSPTSRMRSRRAERGSAC